MATITNIKLSNNDWLHLALYHEIVNIAEINEAIISNRISAAFINPVVIVGLFQLSVAAYKAVHLQSLNKMKTRNIHSEMIYNLSPSKNIKDSFKKFGLSSDNNAVIVACIDNNPEEDKFLQTLQLIKGDNISIERLNDLRNEEQIIKIYNIADAELSTSNLLDAVVSKMAGKDA